MRTKQANSPTATFLHFLIEVCEESHPEILKFYEDLIHVDKGKYNSDYKNLLFINSNSFLLFLL